MIQVPVSVRSVSPSHLAGGIGSPSDCVDPPPQNLDEIKRLYRAGGHRVHRPMQVVSDYSKRRVYRVAYRPFQPTTSHLVISLNAPDHRWRLSAFRPAGMGQRFRFPAVDNFDPGVISINPSISKIDKYLLRLFAEVFQQDRRLFRLCVQMVPVIWIIGNRPRANYQGASVRDRDACLRTKFVRLFCLALSDTLYLGRVHRIELVLSFGLLRTQPLGEVGSYIQSDYRLILRIQTDHLAADLPRDDSQHRPLADQHPTKALELFGVRVAGGAPPQAFHRSRPSGLHVAT